MKTSSLEAKFVKLWESRGDLPDAPTWVAELPSPEYDRRFHAKRLWRFDYRWPAYMLAVELEGGVISVPVTCNHCRKPVTRLDKRTKTRRRVYAVMGGHTTTEGYRADCEKYRAAVVLGWRVLRYTTIDVEDHGKAMIREIANLLRKGTVAGAEEQLSLF